LSAGTGQPYVSQEILGPIETPVVSLAEQQEIVRRVKGLFALADQLEARLAKAQKKAYKLTPSLLARAFAGKLVPQDPNDEPAEKMLERIRKVGPRIARMTWIKRGKDNP
jgi:type I restriction enzyme S subunit